MHGPCHDAYIYAVNMRYLRAPISMVPTGADIMHMTAYVYAQWLSLSSSVPCMRAVAVDSWIDDKGIDMAWYSYHISSLAS
jgi:hypothetical protein